MFLGSCQMSPWPVPVMVLRQESIQIQSVRSWRFQAVYLACPWIRPFCCKQLILVFFLDWKWMYDAQIRGSLLISKYVTPIKLIYYKISRDQKTKVDKLTCAFNGASASCMTACLCNPLLDMWPFFLIENDEVRNSKSFIVVSSSLFCWSLALCHLRSKKFVYNVKYIITNTRRQ